MLRLRNVSGLTLGILLMSCDGSDPIVIPASEAYLYGSIIYITPSDGWVNLNRLLGKNLDHVAITGNPDGVLSVKEDPYDVWSLQCSAPGPGKVRVEEKFVLPAQDYWVSCTHDQGGGG
jgi:hypothetical protein